MAAMENLENYCHRARTILKDEKERKKEIQLVIWLVRANGYQPDEVNRENVSKEVIKRSRPPKHWT